MREIKFRGKTLSGKWVYGYYVGKDTIIPFENVNFDLGFIDTSPCYEVIPDTIGQFTGLHDKNGKEIYFGDIVRNKWGGLGVVVWEECSVNVKWGNVDSHSLFYEEDFEHIDNIHDNPELLNE